MARRLGSHILTETMERRPDIGLDSYDRFFPNQDTLPQGGFGNLIALPLQKQPRELGNSVFLDEQCVPYPDQWAFLSGVRRIARSRVEEVVRDAERRGRIVGVRMALPDEEETEPWAVVAGQPSLGRREGTSACRTNAREPRTDARRPDLYREGAFVAGPPQSAAAAGGISESRVLQGAGHASADLRQAANHKLRRRPSAARRAARGCLDDLVRLFADLHIETAIRDERCAARRWRCSFRANCGRNRRPPPAQCWSARRAFCRPRRPSERP